MGQPVRSAREALDRGARTGRRRDPYRSKGHRLLGDHYPFELNHSAYALIQYRKLKSVRDELEPVERLLLARAYHERDVSDRARNPLDSLEAKKPPESRTVLGRTLRPVRLLRGLRRAPSGGRRPRAGRSAPPGGGGMNGTSTAMPGGRSRA